MKHRATVLCMRGDRILLVAKAGRRWAFPRGSRRTNEPLVNAAIRELNEETTLTAATGKYLFQFWGPVRDTMCSLHMFLRARYRNRTTKSPDASGFAFGR
jgi:ADP-ribose pyrophosphatase YjhB (NUDIX family)